MPRLYGFEGSGRLRESEARVIVEMANRCELGQGDTELSRWLNESGHTTSVGGPWSPHRVGAVLENPAIGGLERAADGSLVPSGGAAAIPAGRFIRLQDLRRERAQARSSRRDPAEYLFGGAVLHCGLCTMPMGASPSNSGSRGYRCQPSTEQHPGGCGKVRINADGLEQFVGEHVLAELAKPEVSALISTAREKLLKQADDVRSSIVAMKKRQEELGAEYADAKLSRRAFQAADKALTRKIKDAAHDARMLEQVRHVPSGGIPDLVRWWQHAPIKARSGLCTLLLERVDVYKAKARGSRTVDSERVALRWRRIA